MTVGTLILGGAALACVWYWHWAASLPLVLVWGWVIAFFRDPNRVPRCGPNEMCAPADGTVTEITRLDHHPHVGGPARRIGIFLSIFNVHINRMPCSGAVRDVAYRPGKFLDARNPRSGAENESNTLILDATLPYRGPVVIRQVSGKIARRIICHASPGDSVETGQRFGLIKFGSRTELIVPDDVGLEVLVKVGDKVHGGETILIRQNATDSEKGE